MTYPPRARSIPGLTHSPWPNKGLPTCREGGCRMAKKRKKKAKKRARKRGGTLSDALRIVREKKAVRGLASEKYHVLTSVEGMLRKVGA